MYSHAIQAKWTSTVTNRLLVEAGYSENYTGYKIAAQDTVQIGPSATSPWGDISKSDLVGHEPVFHQRPDADGSRIR